MIKKIICIVLSICLMLPLFSTVIFADSSDKSIKKIISIAYDDSGSMIWPNNNRKWAYASYSIQNLVGLIDKNDEISITKMSEPMVSEGVDLTDNTTRQRKITSMEGWKPDINGHTPFEAVITATDWLKSKKEQYRDSRSVEYWLIVITDGEFETAYPQDMPGYLSEIKNYMGNSKYESIFVAIGDKVPPNVTNDWGTLTGNHVIKASNSETIVSAMSDVSGLILGQGGKEANITINQTSDRKSISFKSDFPLRKFIIFEQNQQVNIKSITSNGKSIDVTSSFSMKEPENNSTFSKTIHCQSNDFIPAGEVTVTFESEINSSPTNLKIFTDSAVNVELMVLDKSGKEIDLTNSTLVEGDYVEFAAVVTSCIDNKPINLNNWANQLSADLIINEQSIQMEYNTMDNTFYGGYNIKSGSNIAYSVVTLPGYFRAKSDILNVYPIETISNASAKVSSSVLEIPYKYCDEYEEVGEFEYTVSGGTINGICNFEFKNLPIGIKASVNGIQTDENGKISLKIHNDVPADVVFLRNKDYAETDETKIKIDVTSEQYVLKWNQNSITEILLKPIKRDITFDVKEQNTSVDLNKISNTAIYDIDILANGEYLSKEELESLILNFDKTKGISYQSEFAESGGHNVLRINIDKNMIDMLVQTGNISEKLSIETPYSESEEVTLNYKINDSILKYWFPFLLLFLIIVGIGYIPGIKKRIANKKYCISANDDLEQIIVNKASRLLPYACEKGYASVLSVKATNRHDKLKVLKDNIDAMTLNGEDQSEEKDVFIRLDDILVIKQDNNISTYKLLSTSDESFGDEFGDLGDNNLFDDSSSNSDNSDDSIF